MTDPSWSQPPAAPPSPYPQHPSAPPVPVRMWEHPQGTTVLVLAILSFVVGVTAPIAWYLGSKAEKEILAAGVPCANASTVKAGRIIGLVMTIVGGVAVLGGIAYFVFFAIYMAAVFAQMG